MVPHEQGSIKTDTLMYLIKNSAEMIFGISGKKHHAPPPLE